MSYEESLNYLQSLTIFGVRLGLERIKKLLTLLNNPEKRYKTIHVTGTNGKGSVSHFIANVLTKSKIKTALYTSPHLVKYEERMEIDNEPISEKDFAEVITEVKSCVEEMIKSGDECPTQFEVLTAAAFLYFAKKEAEYAVIEVGLGGLLDSTNVITPQMSVITNVTLEHADKCGGTLEGVARHKAGIIKPNIPVVTAATGMPLDIIKKVAKENNSQIFVLNEDFSTQVLEKDLKFLSQNGKFDNTIYALSMNALYQIENSALAMKAVECLSRNENRITLDATLNGMKSTKHAGRFEKIGDVIIDGAHNPAGTLALRKSLDYLFKDGKRTFLIGVLKDKDAKNLLKNLLRKNDAVIVTKPNSKRAMAEYELFSIVKNYVNNITIAKNINDGIEALKNGDGLKIATGSLYLIGEVRENLLMKN